MGVGVGSVVSVGLGSAVSVGLGPGSKLGIMTGIEGSACSVPGRRIIPPPRSSAAASTTAWAASALASSAASFCSAVSAIWPTSSPESADIRSCRLSSAAISTAAKPGTSVSVSSEVEAADCSMLSLSPAETLRFSPLARLLTWTVPS